MRPPFGAIMAGGRNSRYGDLKALAPVAGQAIIDRVIERLRAVTPDLILIANDVVAYHAVDIPSRPDRIPGLGALGGLHSALHWAAEEARDGIIAIACDMPFVSSALLGRLLERSRSDDAPDVVAPESGSRRGLEPLCTYYSVGCLPAIEAAIQRGDSRMIGFHAQVSVERIALAEVAKYGDPETLFMNVNTPEERLLAERIAQEHA
ncbi:MAG: molybdenum cofactor guanylyltransferase [Gemmatimonadota bacterium]